MASFPSAMELVIALVVAVGDVAGVKFAIQIDVRRRRKEHVRVAAMRRTHQVIAHLLAEESFA